MKTKLTLAAIVVLAGAVPASAAPNEQGKLTMCQTGPGLSPDLSAWAEGPSAKRDRFGAANCRTWTVAPGRYEVALAPARADGRQPGCPFGDVDVRRVVVERPGVHREIGGKLEIVELAVASGTTTKATFDLTDDCTEKPPPQPEPDEAARKAAAAESARLTKAGGVAGGRLKVCTDSNLLEELYVSADGPVGRSTLAVGCSTWTVPVGSYLVTADLACEEETGSAISQGTAKAEYSETVLEELRADVAEGELTTVSFVSNCDP